MTHLSRLQQSSIDNLIDSHGIDECINFYLDLIIENWSKRVYQDQYNYWIESLGYVSRRL